jgi:hypothetical protein
MEARHAASASGSSRIEMQAMYSAVNLEKCAPTETDGYSACKNVLLSRSEIPYTARHKYIVVSDKLSKNSVYAPSL